MHYVGGGDPISILDPPYSPSSHPHIYSSPATHSCPPIQFYGASARDTRTYIAYRPCTSRAYPYVVCIRIVKRGECDGGLSGGGGTNKRTNERMTEKRGNIAEQCDMFHLQIRVVCGGGGWSRRRRSSSSSSCYYAMGAI